MKKNDELIVKVLSLGVNGEGIAKVEDKVIFIPFALPSELVKIHILKVDKNLVFAKLLEVLEKSSNRIEVHCPIFNRCGGCNLLHLDYNSQLIFKREQVVNNFKKILNDNTEILPCKASNKQFHYRNKLQLPISSSGIGLYAEGTHKIIECDDCALFDNWCKVVIAITKKFIETFNISKYNELTKTGLIKHLVVRYYNNQMLLTLVINSKYTNQNELNNKTLQAYYNNLVNNLAVLGITKISLFINENTLNNNVVMTDRIVKIFGSDTISISSLGINYEISPISFMQINDDVANNIYNEILTNIDKDNIVLNAYSGAGLLSAIIAKKAKFVYGIEIIDQATKNADALKLQNNIINMENITGDCAIEIPKLVKQKNIDNLLVILDPPRKGCDKVVLETILKQKPNKIIYLSCNSATLARDLITFKNDYTIAKVQPYDMFPQTKHVETLVILDKK